MSQCQLADAILDGNGSACQGTEEIHLKPGTVLGSVTAIDGITSQNPTVVSGMEEGGAEGQTLHDLQPQVCTVVDAAEEQERTSRLLGQLNLKLEHLSSEERSGLEDTIQSYRHTFAVESSELGSTTCAEHTIDSGDQRPTRQPARRMPFALREEVDKLIQEMLSQQVIVPSASPWASPIVLVKKKDGGMRSCVDYRKLNKLDEFPLPRIDDTLDLLAGAKYFTTLELASGYWQVPMEESSQEKTAFITYSGLYEFRKMPFNAPATFQRLMEVVLAGIARDGCHVYLDHVLVFGKTLEEHNHNLFDRINGAGLS